MRLQNLCIRHWMGSEYDFVLVRGYMRCIFQSICRSSIRIPEMSENHFGNRFLADSSPRWRTGHLSLQEERDRFFVAFKGLMKVIEFRYPRWTIVIKVSKIVLSWRRCSCWGKKFKSSWECSGNIACCQLRDNGCDEPQENDSRPHIWI
jgi:hypothetical protein